MCLKEGNSHWSLDGEIINSQGGKVWSGKASLGRWLTDEEWERLSSLQTCKGHLWHQKQQMLAQDKGFCHDPPAHDQTGSELSNLRKVGNPSPEPTAQARRGRQLKAADFKPSAVVGGLERVGTEVPR